MRWPLAGATGAAGLLAVGLAAAQDRGPAAPPARPVLARLQACAGAPGVTGAERAVLDVVRAELASGAAADLPLALDHLGNGTVTVGTGEPLRVVLCHVDEHGWRVTGITDEGYLRLARPGHTAGNDLSDALLEGKPVVVQGERGALPGAVTARSTHLRGTYPPRFDLDQAYVDVGADSAAAARALGVFELAPVAWRRIVRPLAGRRLAGPALGDRVGAAVALAALARLDRAALRGTVVFAFAVQRWHLGYARVGRGGEALAARLRPAALCGLAAAPQAPLGSGAVAPPTVHAAWVATLPEGLAARCTAGEVEDPGLGAFAAVAPAPAEVRAIGVPVRARRTPVEQVDGEDLEAAVALLLHWLASEAR
jgi:putative aminopeptidase FrvX